MSLLLDALKGAEDSRKAVDQQIDDPVDVIEPEVEMELELELDQDSKIDKVVKNKISHKEKNSKKHIGSDSGADNVQAGIEGRKTYVEANESGEKVEGEAGLKENSSKKSLVVEEVNAAEAVFRNRNRTDSPLIKVSISVGLLCGLLVVVGYFYMTLKNENILEELEGVYRESHVVSNRGVIPEDSQEANNSAVLKSEKNSNKVVEVEGVNTIAEAGYQSSSNGVGKGFSAKKNSVITDGEMAVIDGNRAIINRNVNELHKNQNETVEDSVRKDVVLEEESGGKIDNRLSREAPKEVMDTISIRKRYIPNKIKTDLAKGKQAVANGDLEFAERIFSEVLEKFPKNTEALVYMADIMGVQNKNEIARSLYAAALENSPGNLKASMGLINLTRDKTSLNQGSNLKQLIIDNPNRAFLHANLGDYYVGRNEWPAAQAAYFEAFAQNPENANYAFNLAVCLDQLGKGEIALRYYKQALELNKFSKSRFNENSALARVQVLTGVYQ